MGIKWFVKENTWLHRGVVTFGWGNGYVCLPKDHPCYGMDYNIIHNNYKIHINGGLTFSESSDNIGWDEVPKGDYWIVGFDTVHSWDNLEMWPKESVEDETKKLVSQFESIKKATEI